MFNTILNLLISQEKKTRIILFENQFLRTSIIYIISQVKINTSQNLKIEETKIFHLSVQIFRNNLLLRDGNQYRSPSSP